jgi:hypothetical protein
VAMHNVFLLSHVELKRRLAAHQWAMQAASLPPGGSCSGTMSSAPPTRSHAPKQDPLFLNLMYEVIGLSVGPLVC